MTLINSINDTVYDSFWRSVRDPVCSSVSDSVYRTVRGSARGSVTSSVSSSVFDFVYMHIDNLIKSYDTL